jgi:hypothetical protein
MSAKQGKLISDSDSNFYKERAFIETKKTDLKMPCSEIVPLDSD